MPLYNVLRAIIGALAILFAFFVSMLALSFLFNLPSYSINEIANFIGGIHVFIAIIISLIVGLYFAYWNIEDSLKKGFEEYNKELINSLKKINDQITIAYALINELNSRTGNQENSLKDLRERITAVEKLIVELIERSAK